MTNEVKFVQQLKERGIPFQENHPLGPLTWYKLGGQARVFAQPENAEQLSDLIQCALQYDQTVRLLGKGANLLVMDDTLDGVVVLLDAPAFKVIRYEGEHAIVGAGADLAKVILETCKHGLSGLEVLAGIPASVGGAIKMNCGGKYGEIGPLVEWVDCLDQQGQFQRLRRRDLNFEYRRSNIIHPYILSVVFKLSAGDPNQLRDRVKEIFDYKKSTQPLGEKSAGCIFKNPDPRISTKGAGQLIDEAGLKGMKIGGAEVSEVHANFISASPQSSASDVLNLMKEVRNRVFKHSGVVLKNEVVIWPESALEPKQTQSGDPA